MPQFLPLLNGDIIINYLIGLLLGLNEYKMLRIVFGT